MHDLSLIRNIATTVRRCSEGRRVRVVHLQVGQLRRIDPAHFAETWTADCAGTDLEDARMEIELVPVTVSCTECSARTSVGDSALRCGSCGSRSVTVVAGDDMTILSIETAPLEEPAQDERDQLIDAVRHDHTSVGGP